MHAWVWTQTPRVELPRKHEKRTTSYWVRCCTDLLAPVKLLNKSAVRCKWWNGLIADLAANILYYHEEENVGHNPVLRCFSFHKQLLFWKASSWISVTMTAALVISAQWHWRALHPSIHPSINRPGDIYSHQCHVSVNRIISWFSECTQY